MSVTIADLLKLPSLRSAKVVGGKAGLDQTVVSISVLEMYDVEALGFDFPGQSNFYGQELIITAFMAAKDDVEQQCATLHRLKREGIIGVVLFYVGSVLPYIDARLIETANGLNMPLLAMPEHQLELRYGDVICEVVEAIVKDREVNAYFATEIIERISRASVSERNIQMVLDAIRDRVHCSVFLLNEADEVLNFAEWPAGRGLALPAILRETVSAAIEPACVEREGGHIYVQQRTVPAGESDIRAYFLSENTPLHADACDQIFFVLKTYLNLWGTNYGQLSTKQLLSAILNDEPEKMRQIGKKLKIDVKALSCAYFLYSTEPKCSYEQLKTARKCVQDFLAGYYNVFLADIFDETIVVCEDATRERIDKDVPELLAELEAQGLHFRCVKVDSTHSTQIVKSSYWLFQRQKAVLEKVYPKKRIVSIGQVEYIEQLRQLRSEGAALPSYETLLHDDGISPRTREELIDTAEIYLLDADRSILRTTELTYLHKNTIQYRLRSLEKLLGHGLSAYPEVFRLYQAAVLHRLMGE